MLLKGNTITDQGGIAIAATVAHMPNLKQLCLRNNYFGDYTANAIAGAAKHGHLLQLTHLSLIKENFIGWFGARGLNHMLRLRWVPGLVLLSLERKSISQQDMISLYKTRLSLALGGQLVDFEDHNSDSDGISDE